MNRHPVIVALAAILCLLALACEGSLPEAGTAEVSDIEQAFTDELFIHDGLEAGEKLALTAYQPGPGQICMVYGYADVSSLSGDLDVSNLPIYSASVSKETGGDEVYYWGTMWRYWDGDGWEDYATYRYYPNGEQRRFEVRPNETTTDAINLIGAGFDVKERVNGLRPCDELASADPTASQPTP